MITSFFKEDEVSSLQKKSATILDVFTKTINDLKKVNEKVDASSSKREVEMEKLKSELATLSETKTSNQKAIAKIEKIFE